MDIKEILKSANKSSINFDIEVYAENGQAYISIGKGDNSDFTTEVKDEDDITNVISGYIEDTLEELS